ncbi:MAG: hypothetical protein Kow0056_16850 [Coriobacteriia bacterium]
MKPIARGDRGPAVEDVQRRLLALGYDLGPTGVDGVFLGRTLSAVKLFQAEHGLGEDGEVGPKTWAALVDATFRLGDRLLYLRTPFFHGRDVRELQMALNALGFSCGDADGIFGPYTEKAVRDFQRDVGHGPDGIVGPETVAALLNLRHIWEGRESESPVVRRTASARRPDILSRYMVSCEFADETGRDVAERICSVARATHEGARIACSPFGEASPGADLRLVFFAGSPPEAHDGATAIRVCDPTSEPAERIAAAVEATGGAHVMLLIDLSGCGKDERSVQRVAVAVLDGACSGLSAWPAGR